MEISIGDHVQHILGRFAFIVARIEGEAPNRMLYGDMEGFTVELPEAQAEIISEGTEAKPTIFDQPAEQGM